MRFFPLLLCASLFGSMGSLLVTPLSVEARNAEFTTGDLPGEDDYPMSGRATVTSGSAPVIEIPKGFNGYIPYDAVGYFPQGTRIRVFRAINVDQQMFYYVRGTAQHGDVIEGWIHGSWIDIRDDELF